MRYKHWLRIDRGSGAGGDEGHLDANDVWVPDPTPGDNVPVFEGWSDFQDQGVVVDRDLQGNPTVTSDAVAFLKEDRETTPIGTILPDDRATVTLTDGTLLYFTVLRARRLDSAVYLRRV